jgi:ATP-dependent DNA helicase RecQ
MLSSARALLQQYFGYPDFRPSQKKVITAILAGRDALAVLPTGAGKSVCFQIPALVLPGLTVVVSPLIALMQDQVAAARGRGLPAAFLNSTLSATAQGQVLEGARTGAIRLLYLAPERLPRLGRELADLDVRVGLLAVDEAHCISEWGHDFRPMYRTLRRSRAQLGWPQALALTGSATPEVREDIGLVLGLGRSRPKPIFRYVDSFNRPNLRFEVLPITDSRDRLNSLSRLVRGIAGAGIVYAPTRNLTEAIARVLHQDGTRAVPYHAGLTKERRSATLDRFLANDVRVVAATCAFGMGIDKPDVRFVIHWILPATPEAYYQEAGRAGRDGEPSRCILLFHRTDPVLHRRMLETTFPDQQVVELAWRSPAALRRLPPAVQLSVERLRAELRPDRGIVRWDKVSIRRAGALKRIQAVVRYATTQRCRRRVMLEWFGEQFAHCTGCDVCAGAGRPGRITS